MNGPCVKNYNLPPGRTVSAYIRLDIRKNMDVRFELSEQPQISEGNGAPIRRTDIRGYPLGYRCYEYHRAKFTVDIRSCTNNSTQISVILRISKRISARTVQPWPPLTAPAT